MVKGKKVVKTAKAAEQLKHAHENERLEADAYCEGGGD